MKIIGLLLGLLFTATNLSAQTNLSLPQPPTVTVHTNWHLVTITNWIQPGHGYVLLNNQLYANSQFTTVDIPLVATLQVPYNGPVDSAIHPITITATWSSGGCYYRYTIENYPFIRADWTFDGRRLIPSGGTDLYAQAILVNSNPTYDGYGNLKNLAATYDCGHPLITPYPLVGKVRRAYLITNTIAAK